MNKLPLPFIFLFLCSYFGAKAQLQETIEYDYSKNQFTKLPSFIKEGSPVLIQYIGVNKYALKSSASITSVNRSYDDGLSQLQAGLQKLAENKKEAQEEEKAAAISASSTQDTSHPLKAVKKGISDYLEVKARNLAEIEVKFHKIYQSALKINSIMSIDKDITAAAEDPDLNTRALLEGTIFIQSASTGILTPSDFSPKLTSCIDDINESLKGISILINTLNDNLTKATLTASQRKEEALKLDKIVTDLQMRASAIATVYSGQNLKTLQDNAADMGRRSLKLLSQEPIIGPTVIGNADGDFVEISDKLTDKAGRQILEIKPFKIKTYGGSRVDFSVGLSINIGGQGKYKYDLRKNPTNETSGTAMDSVILLSDDEDRLFKFSPAIFVHWYQNTKHQIQWMLTVGLTPDFSELNNSRLSIGTSAGFPSSNNLTRRLVLSIGMSIGYADVLKTKYKGMVDYRNFGELDAADLTEKALKIGAFFSVSYNLGGAGH